MVKIAREANKHNVNTINPEVRKLKGTTDRKSVNLSIPKKMCTKLKWQASEFIRISLKTRKLILEKV